MHRLSSSHREISFAAAERRWTTELTDRFARSPDAYARILDAITPDLQRAATEAESKRKGAGIDLLCARLRSMDQLFGSRT